MTGIPLVFLIGTYEQLDCYVVTIHLTNQLHNFTLIITVIHFQYHRISYVFRSGIIEKSYDIVESQPIIFTYKASSRERR